jgi:hypothetical protein
MSAHSESDGVELDHPDTVRSLLDQLLLDAKLSEWQGLHEFARFRGPLA